MSPGGPSLNELARGLFWTPRDLILMLWAYVDESGVHDKPNGNRQTHLALGGAIAELEAWETLAAKWQEALAADNLCEFHAVRFEKCDGEFVGWSRARQDQLRERLATIIIDSGVLAAIGVATSRPVNGQKFHTAYMSCVTGLAQQLFRLMDRINQGRRAIHVVFAQHQEVRLQDLVGYVGAIDAVEPHRVTITTGRPCRILPLQVADLLVYETRFRFENPHRPMPYTLQRLEQAGIETLCDVRIGS